MGRGAPCRGPIPAGAGGTGRSLRMSPRCGAYPRRRGGNAIYCTRLPGWAGLSPQARGEQPRGADGIRPGGPIPAGAGGTRAAPSGRSGPRAYPRRRGGNDHGRAVQYVQEGLSPQARGEPGRVFWGRPGLGPIPAGAGGTPPWPIARNPWRAYPRRRGGNRNELESGSHGRGLSPQARGELFGRG